MRISSTNVILGSTHVLAQSASRKESLRVWAGDQQLAAETNINSSAAEASAQAVAGFFSESAAVTASAAASASVYTAAATALQTTGSVRQTGSSQQVKNGSEDEDQLDTPTRILMRLLEKMFGKKFRVKALPKFGFDQSAPQSAPAQRTAPNNSSGAVPANWGVEYHASESRTEFEQTQFAAAGVVKTADGREISFSLSLQMERLNVQEERFDFQAGSVPVDPLVLNFDGSAADLGSGTFQFDLQADGQAESLPMLAGGSAFLALDRNQDGVINNGTELFGPSSGQGFSELAQYDSDHNGWIDENDPVYADLRLWQPGTEDSGSLSSLAEKDVGAIYLESASTPFTLTDAEGQAQATTAATGIFLQETGGVGSVQELNYLA